MVVHHGGIGTMAAAAKAGVPQAAFPFMADQFMNQKEMIRIGISPETVAFKKMTAELLTRTISEGLAEARYREKAVEIAMEINGHDGTVMTAGVIGRTMVR
jgi:UDP:flavonoid glycosyltransferase YjiC (YdhE family)